MELSFTQGSPQDDRDEIIELLVDFRGKMSGPHLSQAPVAQRGPQGAPEVSPLECDLKVLGKVKKTMKI